MQFYLSVEDVSYCLKFRCRDRCLASNHSHSPTIFIGFVIFLGKAFHPMHDHIPRKFVPGCVLKDYSRKRLKNSIASMFYNRYGFTTSLGIFIFLARNVLSFTNILLRVNFFTEPFYLSAEFKEALSAHIHHYKKYKEAVKEPP